MSIHLQLLTKTFEREITLSYNDAQDISMCYQKKLSGLTQ